MLIPNFSAVALWNTELVGQISDGAWENSRPYDHYKFWCNVAVKYSPEQITAHNKRGRFVAPEQPSPYVMKKNKYNFLKLMEYIGDRILAIGRMARACEAVDYIHDDEALYNVLRAGEYMPETLEKYYAELTMAPTRDKYSDKYILAVPSNVAVAFYKTAYTLKDFKNDLADIKYVMLYAHNS